MSSMYRLVENARLDARNTFGVAARAPLLVEVADAAALPELFGYAGLRDGPVLVLGGGSNLLFAGDPEGAVLALGGQRIGFVERDGGRALVRADAGVQWHDFVLWTLAHGLAGLENLALIPGTVGAAPIQNIGAYGVEAGEAIHVVEAFERATGELHRLDRDACAFAYRDSLFKREPDRFVVTAVEFAMAADTPLRLDYAGITGELAAMGMADATRASQVAEAVIRIRRRKLPDPTVVGNAGSFFKNPVVPAAQARALHAEHPALPVFPLAPFPADAALKAIKGSGSIKGSVSFTQGRGTAPGTTEVNEPDPFNSDPFNSPRKLSAAWLIDACGWKGQRQGDAGVAASHALVLVNHGGATGAQLLDLARRIAESVHDRFGVALEPEPRIIGARW